MKAFIRSTIAALSLFATICSGQTTFDLNAWKDQYGSRLTPSDFYKSRPGPWHDYFDANKEACANGTFLYLGPLGIKARPYDQAITTPAFSALYPQVLVDSAGLIQNAFGVMDAPAGSPADGKVYPGDVIIEMEGQTIKTATDVSFPFPVLVQHTRGLEIHAGQLVDAAEGRGAIKLKVLRAALTNYTSPLLSEQTTAEITVDVTGKDFVRLTTVSANNGQINWINPRLENNAGESIYLNNQAIVQICGYATPQMGKSASGEAVMDGGSEIPNSIGTRANSMIEYAVPAGYTKLKFKVQATATGSSIASIKTRKVNITTTPLNPRQFDNNGAPILPSELAAYTETIEFDIPRIGSFGDSYDPQSDKVANYAAILAHRLASEQQADGSWPSGGGDYADGSFRTSLAGLGLLATGDPAYDSHIKKAAYYCAAVSPSGWAYPRGIRLMFLSEYYLRTRDEAILPDLQKAVKHVEDTILADFVSGHGSNPGYGGGAYIGATGTVATGLAIASKTPVIVDIKRLDNMMERIQELAGGNGGTLPYGRTGNRNAFPVNPSVGQSYSCGAGGVLASNIYGGPKYIHELFRKKFGAATAYGDVDGGHASEALTFIMGSLACGIWGDESHKANMDRFLWRLTLKRDYSGYINLNTNRLEFHGGDAGCHGGPTYDTGGYLILLNEHKRNLAITGKPETQAQEFPDTPPTYSTDRKIYWRVLNDWNMVDAALGSKMPASLQSKLAELRAMPLGLDLGSRTIAFVQREGLAAAKLVNEIPDLTSPERQYYCEMLLGVGHEIQVASIDKPVPTSGLSNYRFSLNGYTAATTWKAWGGPSTGDEHPSTKMTGTVTLTDPTGNYFSTPVVLDFSPSNLNPTANFQFPVDTQVNLTAEFNYTVGGSLTVAYTREIIVNPSVPFNVDPRAGNYTNLRKVWIPGTCPAPFHNWISTIQLPSGQILPGASKKEGGMGFYTYDNGVLVTADNTYKSRIAGKPAGYWCVSCDRLGECPVLGVNLLPGPVLTTTSVSALSATSATSGGKITSDNGWPITSRGICWSTSPYPSIFDNKTTDGSSTGSFTSELTNLKPGTIYHIRAYATNAIGTSYGENIVFNTSGISGTWVTVGGGSWLTTSNWQNGIAASGADGIANFGTVTPTGDAVVTLDGPRTLGGMIFGNASFKHNWILNAGSGSAITLDYGVNGYPSIAVNGGTAIINTVVNGTDGLVKNGAGTLILNANHQYTGITNVNAGTLQLNGSLSSGSPVSVAAGGSLSGTGTVNAATTVAGTVTPGVANIGSLHFSKSIALKGTADLQINQSTGASDKLIALGSVSYGGTLKVTNVSGTLAAGDSFTLFSAGSYSGEFSSLVLPPLSGNLKWVTSNLLVDGSIQVGYDAVITGQPSDRSIAQGATATFVVNATGSPEPSYQWQISTNGGSSWSMISGATAHSYTTPPVSNSDNNQQFRCIVSNGLTEIISNAAKLTVTTESMPSFTLHPRDVVVTSSGQNASFTIATSGSPAPTWQWQSSTDFGASWADVVGASDKTLSVAVTDADNNKMYRCVATNSHGSVSSNMALLIISADPVWMNRDGGAWPTQTNWSNNTIANGVGVTADFSRLNLFAAPTVTLTGARTIGNLKFGDVTNGFGWTLNTSSTSPLTLASDSGTPTITVNNQQALVSCLLAGANGLVKEGSGNLILTAANTYSGGTTLNAGQLTINHNNAIGGGVLAINGGSLGNTSGDTITLTGSQTWNADFSFAGPNNLVLASPVTLNANCVVNVEGGDLQVSSAISGAYGLTKKGSSALTLIAGNSFTGGLIVDGGTVNVNPGAYVNILPNNSTITVNSGGKVVFQNTNNVNNGTKLIANHGGILEFQGTHAHIVSLELNGGTLSGTGRSKYANEDFALDGDITVGGDTPSTISIANGMGIGNRTITVADVTGDASADLTIQGNGAIRSSGRLTKAGDGTFLVTTKNVNSGGTVISAGEMRLSGGSLGSGAVSVAEGATLSGSGDVSGVSTVHGNLTTGVDLEAGTLTFASDLELTSTAVTTMKIKVSSGIESSDKIIAGNSIICAGTLNVVTSGEPLVAGNSFQLFSATSISGTFSAVNLPQLSNGLTWDTSSLYVDGTIRLGKVSQTITFAPLAPTTYGQNLVLQASASSGLYVSFTSSNPSVALIQYGNYVKAVGVGTTVITASQPGNSKYNAAVSVSRSLTVTAAIPGVITVAPTQVNTSEISTGGKNIWDGGSPITERGVCWSTNDNPTVNDNRMANGSGSDAFSTKITGITPNQTYYFRAYVRNSAGYGYGVAIKHYALDGATWVKDESGSWLTSSNWFGGISPSGVDKIVNFNAVDLTADRTVSLDGARTIGSLIFGDVSASHNWILNAGTGGSLTLNTSTGSPVIAVANQTATIEAGLNSTQGFVKSGLGTLALGSANTLSGPIVISQGSVRTSVRNSLGTGTVTLGDANSGDAEISLRYPGAQPLSNPIVVAAEGTGKVTIGTSSWGYYYPNGSLTLNRAVTLDDATRDRTAFLGKISGPVGTITLTGTRISFDNGANDFVGDILVSNGTTYQNNATGALPDSTAVTMLGFNSKFLLKSDTETIGALNGYGRVDDYLGGVHTLIVGGADRSGSFSGEIVNGVGTVHFSKIGTGSQVLEGVNTYNGTTSVLGGSLIVNGSLGDTTTTVAVGATLGGSGSISGVVTNHGRLAPGNNAIGTLTIHNKLLLAEGSEIAWQLGDWLGNAGEGWDKLSVTALDVTATSAKPIVIRLADLDLKNFSETNSSFVFLETTSGITGFSEEKFAVDTNGLTLPRGSWKVQQSGNNLVLAYTPQNNGPTFSSDPVVVNATEGTAFIGQLNANHPDSSETLTFTKVSGTSWINVASNGALSGTPSNEDVGSQSIMVRVTDRAGLSDEATLVINVANVNNAPSFHVNPIVAAAAVENTAYNGTIAGSASDVDANDNLQFSLVTANTWLKVAANGGLSGTPTSNDVGTNSFTVRVTDAEGQFSDATLSITVTSTTNNGVWVNAAGGSWKTPGNWSGEVIASGAGKSADFTTLDLVSDAVVSLDGGHIIGNLRFADASASHNWIINPGNSGSLTLADNSGIPSVSVANQSVVMNAAFNGSQGLTKSGEGTLVLTAMNAYTGGTTIANGVLQVGNGGTSGSLGAGQIINNGMLAYHYSSASTLTLPTSNVLSGSGNLSATAGIIKINGNLSVGGSLSLTQSGGNSIYTGIELVAADVTLTGSSISLSGDVGKRYSNGHRLTLDTSSVNGPIDLNISLGRYNVWYIPTAFTANAGVGPIHVSGSGPASTGWRNTPVSLTGAVNISGNVHSDASVTIHATADGTVSGILSGAMPLVKQGDGKLVLTNANTYTGSTTVNAGTLNVTGSLANSAVFVLGGALEGSGTINGATTVQSAGTLAPGSAGIGELTINNSLVLGGTAEFELDKTGTSLTNDSVKGVSELTYAGVLTVTATGEPLAAGDTFQLFTATNYSGSFTEVNLPTLAAGLEWDDSQLAVDGSIRVVSTTYTLTYIAGENGSITGTTPQVVNKGANGSAVTAVPNTGYHFVKWSDGNIANPRTDANVTGNVSVTAEFAADSFTLTYVAGANGKITGASPQTVAYGNSGSSVTAEPNTGYHFVKWSDGNTANPRIDANVAGNVSVTAEFAVDSFTLTYVAGENGVITGASPQTVTYGNSGSSVTAVPNTGYHFVKWSDGNIANPRTDANVTGNVSVTAEFAIDSFTLTYAAGENGVITGASPQTVTYGNSGSSVTAEPNAGYHFVKWSDGNTANPRTDTNVTGNVSVTAEFANLIELPSGSWPIDEGIGTKTADTSGNGYDGTITGATWITGRVGNALQFNKNRVDLGNLPLGNKISLAAWIKPDSVSVEQSIFGRAASFTLKVRNGNLRFTTPGVRDHDFSGNGLKAGVWQHVAVSFDAGVSGGARVYVNGQLVGSVNASQLNTNSNPVLLGANQWIGQEFVGAIDEAVIYNGALTDAQVAALYATYPAENNAPVFASSTITKSGATVNQNLSDSIAADASDLDEGDTLTFKKVNGPLWLSVAADGTLSGTPATSDVGTNEWTVEVSDGRSTDTAILRLTVSPPPNQAPQFEQSLLVKENAKEGAAYAGSIAGDASDPDAGSTLTFRKVAGPAWLVVAPDGSLSGTPQSSDAGTSQWTVEVSDGSLVDTATLQITIDALPIHPASYGALGETTVHGNVYESDYTDTLSSDNVYEALLEGRSSSNINMSYNYLEHIWNYNIGAGGSKAVLSVEAHHTYNSENDHFVFAYSTDGVNYTDAITVTKLADDNIAQTFTLPDGISGQVWIRVRDTDRTPERTRLDVLEIDKLSIDVTP